MDIEASGKLPLLIIKHHKLVDNDNDGVDIIVLKTVCEPFQGPFAMLPMQVHDAINNLSKPSNPIRLLFTLFIILHNLVTVTRSHLGDVESGSRRSDLKDGWAVENGRVRDGGCDIGVGDEGVCLTHCGSRDSSHNHITLHGTSDAGSAQSTDKGDEEGRWHHCGGGESEGDAWCSRDPLGGGQSREGLDR